MRIPRRGILACAFLAFLLVGPANAERRVALVIGNDAYAELPVLRKAVADAESFAAVLEEKGFQVILRTDLTRQAMDLATATFIEGIEPGDTAVFVYSGHGWSDGVQNYLVGTDAPKTGSQEFLARISVPLRNGVNGVIDEMERRGAALKVAIIDACRDNPFVSAAAGRSVGLGRGLSRVEPPSGTFVVFSADAGQTALDRLSDQDADPNSVFTRTFLPLIRADRPLLEAVKAAQKEVDRLGRTVAHQQRPAYYDAVLGEACLSENCRAIAVVPDGADGVPSADTIAADYAAAERINTTAAWDAFLRKHGKKTDDFYVQLALAARGKLALGVFPEPPQPVPEQPPANVAAPSPQPPGSCGDGVIAKVGDEDRCLRPKDVFKDCDDCPEMVVVPAGTFMMGSPKDEDGRLKNEGPQHDVKIAEPFSAGKYEVSFQEWEACQADRGCPASRQSDARQSTDLPVVGVSWDDAQSYAAWLSRRTGHTYRLLSEAEWEYAARAGTATPFFTGRIITAAQASLKGLYADRASSVRAFEANGFGLHNMHGNVWEWTADCLNDTYDRTPTDGSAATTGDCVYRVLRGGSFREILFQLRSAKREWVSSDFARDDIGFRVARTLGDLATATK